MVLDRMNKAGKTSRREHHRTDGENQTADDHQREYISIVVTCSVRRTGAGLLRDDYIKSIAPTTTGEASTGADGASVPFCCGGLFLTT